MSTDHRDRLRSIRTFPSLIKYLRDELDWPIESDDFEDLTFEYSPEELGIDAANAAKIQEIKRLRPLAVNQPWGIFFVKFEPKRLPVVALRRILSRVVVKKRASANSAERAVWEVDDLLFVSNYGEGEERHISLAHFAHDGDRHSLPTLRVLGWDNLDTPLHFDGVVEKLRGCLRWPENVNDTDSWRDDWRAAFTVRHREAIKTSSELSQCLAELAGAIRNRIKAALAIESEAGPLTTLMKAIQEALVHDLDADGFADTYAQTIAYGLLSARVTDPDSKASDDLVGHMRTNPFLREMVELFLETGARRRVVGGAGIDFDELGVSDVIELLEDANMEEVLRDFGDQNPLEDPVIHFYEHFLTAYDKNQKVQRGVFYTPRSVVSYIVRSVDELLRTDFGLSDGLADTSTWAQMADRLGDLPIPDGISPNEPFVMLLDPATGTGTFLVEVIDLIHSTMVQKWRAENRSENEILVLWNEYVPEHLLPRLHGYELLMAPYAIAHLKVGLKLFETGYCFAADERARIYLTNALEPASDQQLRLGVLPAIAHEAEAVELVKRNRFFTVAIGNPPYAGHSANNQVAWIVDKVHDYKRGHPDLEKPGQAKWLQDDYVKFLRLVEWHIERTGVGIIGFITNHAWLENPTFKGMRQHLLRSFDRLILLDLHGNTNKREVTAEGTPDENVFEIKQGVAVSLLVRLPGDSPERSDTVKRSDLLGTDEFKHKELLGNTFSSLESQSFKALAPEFVFDERDEELKIEYQEYCSVPDIFNQNGDPAPGIVTTHDEFAISFTPEEQIKKVEALLATETEAQARKLFRLCTQNQWNYENAKEELASGEWRAQTVPILYRPYDVRSTVYNRHVAVHRRDRVSRHFLSGRNLGLSVPRATEIKRGWEHVFCSRLIIQHHTVSLKEVNYIFPLYLRQTWPREHVVPNLSPHAIKLVSESTALLWEDGQEEHSASGSVESVGQTFGARDIFDYVYAILHSAAYRSRYADFLKGDFARIPLSPTSTLFRQLSHFGAQLVDLHLMDSPGPSKPMAPYSGPGAPEVGRVGWSDSTVWIDAVKTNARQGQRSTIPGTKGFVGVPEDVWDYHIGGYQICHKWLKDRKGRTLSKQEIDHYQRIVFGLKETIRLMSGIDSAIAEQGGWPDAFQTLATEKDLPAELKVAENKPLYNPS
ncbi:type ISP restriction/modification enzyme [Gemmatimonadota bacterium]